MSIVKINNEEQFLKFVDNKINVLHKEHEEDVKKTYYLKKEYSVEEYEKIIEDLYEKIRHPPVFKSDNEAQRADAKASYITPLQIKEEYIKNIEEEIKLVRSDLSKALGYQQYVNEERQRLMKIPRNNEMLTENLIEYIKKQVNYYHRDLMLEYFDMFVEKVKGMVPKDKNYDSTIKSIYRNRNGKKAMKILDSFADKLISALTTISYGFRNIKIKPYGQDAEHHGTMKETQNGKAFMPYRTVEDLMKNKFTNIIEKIYNCIYNFIKNEIECIPGDDELTSSEFVKIYAESLMGNMNNAIINNLPAILDDEFSDRIEYLKEDLSANVVIKSISYGNNEQARPMVAAPRAIKASTKPVVEEIEDETYGRGTSCHNEQSANVVVIPKVNPENKKSISMNLENFIESLPDDYIELKELTEMYNKFFGVNISTLSLGKLKGFKENFEIKRKTVNKVKSTYYKRIC